MARCEIVEASPEDVRHVAANLRAEHVREIRGLVGLDPADAVRLSVETSARVFALRAGGECLAVAGASKRHCLSDTGSVWMLATAEMDRHALEAAAALRGLFARAHELTGASILEQYVPAWYAKGLKWLLWLGWTAGETRDIRGQPHIRMIVRAGPCRTGSPCECPGQKQRGAAAS